MALFPPGFEPVYCAVIKLLMTLISLGFESVYCALIKLLTALIPLGLEPVYYHCVFDQVSNDSLSSWF